MNSPGTPCNRSGLWKKILESHALQIGHDPIAVSLGLAQSSLFRSGPIAPGSLASTSCSLPFDPNSPQPSLAARRRPAPARPDRRAVHAHPATRSSPDIRSPAHLPRRRASSLLLESLPRGSRRTDHQPPPPLPAARRLVPPRI